jgi:hypothetical protein
MSNTDAAVSGSDTLEVADAGEILSMLLETIMWVRLAEERARPCGPSTSIMHGAELVLRSMCAGHVVEIDLPLRSLHGSPLASPRLGSWSHIGSHVSDLAAGIERVLDAMEGQSLYGTREWQARMVGVQTTLRYLAAATRGRSPARIEHLTAGLLECLGCREFVPIPFIAVPHPNLEDS